MKRALIITYYWPPMGGGGVQRWLKFVKYLRHHGWEPVVFTTEQANVSIRDESLEKDVPKDLEVIRCPITEPYEVYNRLLGKKKGEGFHTGFIEEGEDQGNALVKKFAMWVRGSLFIPDAKMLWIRPATRTILKYLKENAVDAVISTGPPHTTHMIAKRVKKKTGLPWLADFRDPWTNIDWYQQLDLSKWADKRHHRLEKEVLQGADKVVTVSWSWARDMEAIAGRRVTVVTNGFDEADFQNKDKLEKDHALSITHAGAFNKDRNPSALWKVLGVLCQEDPFLKDHLLIRLIGPTDHLVRKEVTAQGMEANLEMVSSLPHAEVIDQLSRSQVLLLPLNDTPNVKGVIPGKLYEYLGAQRPILCIGDPAGDSASIIKDAEAGYVIDFGDEASLYPVLREIVDRYKNDTLTVEPKGIDQYGRKKLAGDIAALLDTITSG